MSKMSPVLSQQQRREVIKDNITKLSYKEISQLCGVTKRTIRRDVEEWKHQGGYDEFLTEEFFKLYGIIKLEDPRHAFDRLCDLLRRRQDQIQPPQEEQVDAYELVWRKKVAKQTTGD